MCQLGHKIFKKVFGKNQKLDLFVWSMRFMVFGLYAMPAYLMNYVSIANLYYPFSIGN